MRLALAGLAGASAAAALGCGGTSQATRSATTPNATSAAAATTTATGAVRTLASRPDLRPPRPTITRSDPAAPLAPGFIFVTPKTVFGAKVAPGVQGGAEMLESGGRVRWFKPNQGRNVANDLQVQTYQGQRVLTYWSGRQISGSGQGYGVILDRHYRRIATVRAGNGLKADFHEFNLTPQGSALITAYRTTTAGGKKVTEGVLQEVDVETGKVLTQWHSLKDVPVSDSYEPTATRTGGAFDYFHINSAALDDDGNIVVSARHTWALYKIERHTGKLLWTLGGKHSDFTEGPGAQTAWQHHVRPEGGGVYRIFDNAAGDTGAPKLHAASRIVRIKLDTVARTVSLVGSFSHPDGLSAGTQGSSEVLPNGNVFVGWGSRGVFSEFTASGTLLLDGKLPKADDSYRAFKDDWTGEPTAPPALSVSPRGTDLVLRASWNGSTAVAGWRALVGTKSSGQLHAAGRVGWENLETGFTVPAGTARYAAIQALDADGTVLATSPPQRIGG